MITSQPFLNYGTIVTTQAPHLLPTDTSKGRHAGYISGQPSKKTRPGKGDSLPPFDPVTASLLDLFHWIKQVHQFEHGCYRTFTSSASSAQHIVINAVSEDVSDIESVASAPSSLGPPVEVLSELQESRGE